MTLPWPPDEATLHRLRAGVRLMALRTLRDLDAAEDAAQETVTRALTAIRMGRLADPAKLGAFTRGIAAHVITDVIRERQRLKPLDAEHSPSDPTVDPLLALISEEERVRLRGAFATLSQDDQLTLRLIFTEGLSPVDLAERTGLPAGRLRKRKTRAIERLRRAFFGRPEASGPAATVLPVEQPCSHARPEDAGDVGRMDSGIRLVGEEGA